MQLNSKQALNLTHFVRIPLATRASLSQILTSYSRVKEDTLSAVIPKGAFTHPANLHLPLGTLSLPTRSHVEAALNVLKSAITRQGDQPFTVRVVGIGDTQVSLSPRKLSGVMGLYSRIEDPTTSLQGFCQNVCSELLDEGLLKLIPGEKFTPPLQVRVISTKRLTRDPVMGKRQKFQLRPRFDATDLHRKYKDFVFLKDLQL